MQPISSRWNTDVLLADGAMGTLLLDRAPATTTCVERLNLDHRELVARAHAEYVAAGARLIESNTFAANRLKLAAHELREHLLEINTAGVRLAREAAGDRAYVAGSIGPLGALMRPLGLVEHGEASEVFAEHIAAVAGAAPDLLLLETFGSVEEALLALAEAKRIAPSLPVVVSLSVLEDGKTPGGDPLLPALRRLRAEGADALGVNCAVGPQGVYDVLAPVIAHIDVPVFVMPNAGYPHRIDDRAVYQSSPEYFRRFAHDFVAIGANVIGGCCGTTPEHIAAVAAAAPDLLLLETFGSVEEALLALAEAKRIVPSLPVVVSLSVLEDGKTPGGDPLLPALRRLRAEGADALGVNCAVGPQGVYDVLAPVI
ncbi:MAG TPA: homocysteine S-methyltransferase family protein, partial [Candidatus Eremiobacteraceae bacterium]|nr:homocysteine S-methyltransferase family protein [Candidatus Eremiobacteraceae bacterium]